MIKWFRMIECTERSEGRESMPGLFCMIECAEYSEGRASAPRKESA